MLSPSTDPSTPNPFSLTSTGQPTISNAIVSYIQASRIINLPSSYETSLGKAAFYDEIIAATDEGDDELTALERGALAAKAVQKELEELEELKAAQQEVEAPRENMNEQPLEEPTVAANVQPTDDGEESSRKLDSKVSIELPLSADPDLMIMSPSLNPPSHPAWPSVSSPKHPKNGRGFKSSFGNGTFRGFIDNIIRPAVRGKMYYDYPSTTGGDLTSIRMLYNKLVLTIDDYDHVTLADANARAKEMLDSYRQSIEAVEKLTRQRVVAEYQKLIQEVEELKVYKSNAEAEMKILLSDCAKRRIYCSALKKRFKTISDKLEETEKVVISLEADLAAQSAVNPNYTMTPRSSLSKRSSFDMRGFNGKRRSTLQVLRLSKFGPEIEGDNDSLAFSSDEDRMSITSRRSRDAGHVLKKPIREDCEDGKSRCGLNSSGFATSDDNMSEDDVNDEEWEAWCKENDFRRPTWNTSVKSSLLNTSPPSVIHIGDNQAAGVVEAIELISKAASSNGAAQVAAVSGASAAFTFSDGSAIASEKARKRRAFRDEVETRIRKRYDDEINRIRLLFKNERKKARKYLCISVKHETSCASLIRILEKCLADVVHERKDDEQTSLEDIESNQEKRSQYLTRLLSQESLLKSILMELKSYHVTDGNTTDDNRALPSLSPSRSSKKKVKKLKSAETRMLETVEGVTLEQNERHGGFSRVVTRCNTPAPSTFHRAITPGPGMEYTPHPRSNTPAPSTFHRAITPGPGMEYTPHPPRNPQTAGASKYHAEPPIETRNVNRPRSAPSLRRTAPPPQSPISIVVSNSITPPRKQRPASADVAMNRPGPVTRSKHVPPRPLGRGEKDKEGSTSSKWSEISLGTGDGDVFFLSGRNIPVNHPQRVPNIQNK
ncbi:hypothetical protein HDU67_009175 [Dinochytrium kinnereticum]|nr:hypothetical protein HDU67_009175 [Dinochytrium kinnereticum]